MFIQLKHYGSPKILDEDSKFLFFTNKGQKSFSSSCESNLCLISSLQESSPPPTRDNKSKAVDRVKTEQKHWLISCPWGSRGGKLHTLSQQKQSSLIQWAAAALQCSPLQGEQGECICLLGADTPPEPEHWQYGTFHLQIKKVSCTRERISCFTNSMAYGHLKVCEITAWETSSHLPALYGGPSVFQLCSATKMVWIKR